MRWLWLRPQWQASVFPARRQEERGEDWCGTKGFCKQTTKRRGTAGSAGGRPRRRGLAGGGTLGAGPGSPPERHRRVSTATAAPPQHVRGGRTAWGRRPVPSPAAENLLLPAGQGHRGPAPQMVRGTPAAGGVCPGAVLRAGAIAAPAGRPLRWRRVRISFSYF